MPIALVVLVCLLGLAAPAAAQPPETVSVSLAAAIDAAMRENPEVRLAREQIEEFGLRVRGVRADALPQVNLVGTFQRTRDPGLRNSPFFSRLTTGPEPLPQDALNPFYFGTYFYRLEVEQPLYHFGRVGNALEAARQELQGVETDVRGVETRIAFDVARAYYDLLLARERREVLETEREARERELQQVRDRLELGETTRLELLQAEVAMANLRPEVLTADNTIRVALTRLNGVLGRAPLSPFEPADTLAALPELPQLPDIQGLFDLADEHRAELRRYQLTRSVLEAAEGVTRADTMPEISARGNVGINSFRVDNLARPAFHGWTLGVDVRWTIFDGFRTSSTIGQLRSQRRQSELDEAAFRAGLARDLERARGDWEQALETVDVAALAVDQAREAGRVAEELFGLGAATFLDVLAAARALRQAELMRLQASHAALSALAEVKTLVGLRPDAANATLTAGRSTGQPIAAGILGRPLTVNR
jgi:outer membrane protein TolC